MKKYVLFIIGVLAMSLLCGCSRYKLDLTASEHDKIAEYAAYALLSNADDYKNKLLDQAEVDRILAERELEEKIRQEMENLNNQTTKPDKPANPDETTDPNDKDPTTKPDKPGIEKTIDDILNVENVSIQYAGYELCRIYPNDSTELVVLKAKDGRQFVVISFLLQNTSNHQTECNILARDIVYRLNLVNGNTYKAMLTAMGNDFATWDTPLQAQSMNMAFLVFEVQDTLTAQDLDGATLSFRENGITQSVVLK